MEKGRPSFFFNKLHLLNWAELIHRFIKQKTALLMANKFNQEALFQQLEELNDRFRKTPPAKLLNWIDETLNPHAAMITSFQVSGVVLIHMAKEKKARLPIYHIDTGYHFPETLEFKERLVREWELQVKTIKPALSRMEFEQKYGKEVYKKNPDLCCQLNKVEPLNRLKKKGTISFWISAVRKDQTSTRAHFEKFMKDEQGYTRIHPLLEWDKEMVWNYVKKHKLPFHPLYDQGYSSIGCFPLCCTARSDSDDPERNGRWAGKAKTECGLHSKLKKNFY